MHGELWSEKLLEGLYFEDQAVDRRLILRRWDMGRYVLRMRGGWNWFRILSNNGLCS